MKTFKQFNEEVRDIIKGGISTFLNKNKNVSVGDFINPEKRAETIENIKSRGKKVLSKTLSKLGNEIGK